MVADDCFVVSGAAAPSTEHRMGFTASLTIIMVHCVVEMRTWLARDA